MSAILFCNIARMDAYRGWTSVDQPVGGGRYPDKEEVHNFHPFGNHLYGYVAAVRRSIAIERLGASETQPSVGGVNVVWTAPSPDRGRYVVGWYRDATVFRHLQSYERGPYHVLAKKTDYVLLRPGKRTLTIDRARDRPGGFGNSNVWYADTEYGREVRKRVTRLFQTAQRQVFDRDDLDDQADALRPLVRPPRGVNRPSSSKREVTVVGRDPRVQRWVLQRASGRCELCGEPAPFDKPNGSPFLEVHHVRRLADGGSDVPSNAVALCPNCHREAHLGARSQAIVKRLREYLSRRSRG